MPIHDWTRVTAGTFHDFHQGWTVKLCNALNRGILPNGFFAMIHGTHAGTETGFTDPYVARANSVAIKRDLDHNLALIEVISPGDKSTQYGVREFIHKTHTRLRNGVHLLVVDLFPPTPRDPQGLHKAIWDNFTEEPFELPPDKPLTVAAYLAGEVKRAYVEPVAVGDVLPSLPIFLDEYTYVSAPLEESYMAAWAVCPEPVRRKIENL